MESEYAFAGGVTIEPDGPVEAGKVGTWALTLTVGRSGVATGGGFRIMPPVTEPGEHYNMIRWQLDTVRAEGPPGSLVRAEILLLNRGRYDGAYAQIVEVKNLGRPLEPGEEIRVVLERAVASRFAMTGGRFEVEVDPNGRGRYSCVEEPLPAEETKERIERYRVREAPVVEVAAGPAVMLRAAAAACPEEDGKFRLVVSARDVFMNRARAFKGKVVFEHGGTLTGLPGEYRFKKSDAGAHTFRGISAGDAGVTRVRVKVAGAPVECVSTPMVSDFPMRVFFGDLHCHHNLDRGPSGAEALYEHARDFAGLDFVAMTDYDAHKLECREVTRRWNEPGRFVTLFAEEWSDRESADHRNVYYRGDPGDITCKARDSAGLFERFRGQEVLIVPHTPNIDCLVGWKHTDWSRHDRKLQRLVEICQIRGDCEEEGLTGARPMGGHGSSARSALARGLRLGFVGGSDTHRGTPGGPGHRLHPLAESTGPPRWGETAVLAESLTREAVFDALRARRCYATTGARILLWVEVNGRPMGSEITGKLRVGDVRIRFHAEEAVSEIAVIKNGAVWRRFAGFGRDGELALWDESVLEGMNYYYVRLTQEDGHRAWSSPVWLDVPG